MASPPSTPHKNRSGGDASFGSAEPLPLPEAVEHSPDTGWDLWTRVEKSQDVPFSPTAPASLPAGLGGDRAYAPTVPAGLEGAAGGGAPGEDALDVVLREARWGNRVCLRPDKWRQLYEMLPNKVQQPGGWKPPPPIIGAAWGTTSSIPKRLRFQEHLMWAHKHGVLDEVAEFMRLQSESDWLHMGED